MRPLGSDLYRCSLLKAREVLGICSAQDASESQDLLRVHFEFAQNYLLQPEDPTIPEPEIGFRLTGETWNRLNR